MGKISGIAVVIQVDGKCHTVNLTEEQRYRLFDFFDGEINVSQPIADISIDAGGEVDLEGIINIR